MPLTSDSLNQSHVLRVVTQGVDDFMKCVPIFLPTIDNACNSCLFLAWNDNWKCM